MQKAQAIGYIVLGALAALALALIIAWQSGGNISAGSMLKDGRLVKKVASPGPQGKYSRDDLQPGDKILKINGIPVSDWNEAYKILQALYMPPSDTITFEIVRKDDDGRTVKVEGPVRLEREKIPSLMLSGAPRGHSRPDTSLYQASARGLFDAARAGNASAVRDILETGGKKFIDALVDDQSALIVAVAGGHVSVVKELIEHNADVNRPAADQTTALMKAAEFGNQEIVAMLLAAGADPSARNSELKTASDIADTQGFLEVANFIDNPSPAKFLNADQKRKAIEKLNEMGLLKTQGYRATDPELGQAIKDYQRLFGLPQSGILTADNFGDLIKNAKKRIQTKNDEAVDDATQKTLSRVFSRAFVGKWTPVDSLTGYPACENESVLFSISADQRTINWATFRPGVSDKQLGDGAQPTQEAHFRIVKASQEDGYDTITVKPDPRPLSGYAVQIWEIRDGTMKISLKEKEESEETTKGSFLAECH
jgi:hypothetical protein